MRPRRYTLLLLALAGAIALAASSAPAATSRAGAKSRVKARPVVPFIQDDYAKALAQARARKVPLFIEAWAPW